MAWVRYIASSQSKQQNSRPPLSRRLLRLLGLAGSIARALGSIFRTAYNPLKAHRSDPPSVAPPPGAHRQGKAHPRRSCGSNRATEDLFAPLAHSAATLFANLDRSRVRNCALYCTFITRKRRDTGAACNHAGAASRSQPTQLANACGFTNNHMIQMPAFDSWRQWNDRKRSGYRRIAGTTQVCTGFP
jgi:hypothetical protein